MPPADLTADNVSLSGSTLSFHINNVGTTAAGASTAGVYLSTDATITSADTLINTFATPSLGAGATDNESVLLSLPGNLAPGTYYLGVIADEAGAVGESNEANNASSSIAIVLGDNNANTLTGTAGADYIYGLGGNDTVAAGAGADTVFGGNGADIVNFAAADLTSADTVDGGSDASLDRLTFTTTGTVAAAAFANVSHIEQIVLINGTNNITLSDALVGSADDAHLVTIFASSGNGNDTIDGSAVTTAANKLTITSGGGNDTLTGGAGADSFVFAAAELTSGDTVNGGTGASLDRLSFSTAGTIAAGAFTNVSHIEQIVLAAGGNSLALSDATVGSADDGQLLMVIGGSGNDTIDASAVTTASNKVTFTSGTGNDTLTGGAGADLFNFAAADLTNADTVNGGTGASLDRLTFTTAGTVAAAAFANVSHIEQIVLTNGANNIALSDAMIGSADDGHLVTIFASSGNGNDTIDGSAVTTAANHLTVTSGSGNDTLTGGAGSDSFLFAAAELTSGDTVNGGTGASIDRIGFSTAGTIAASAFTNVSHIEQIVLANGTNNIALNNAMVSSADNAQSLSIVGGTGNDTINASAVTGTATHISFNSGSGNDFLSGGAGGDTFTFVAADLTSADTVNGGLNGSVNDSLTFTTAGTIDASALSNVSHIENIALGKGTNNFTVTNALVASSDDLHKIVIFGNTGNDTIDASAVAGGGITFVTSGGDDTLIGGDSFDTFNFAIANLTSGDTVNGGTGAGGDTLVFTDAGTVGPSAFTNVTHIENIFLANGTNHITLSNAVIAAADNGGIGIRGGTGDDTIDASAGINAARRVGITGGGGNDTLIGGTETDTFSLNLTSGDTVNGGTGAAIDVLNIDGESTINADDFANVSHIERINISSGINHLTLSDALVGSADDGHLLSIVHGSSEGNDTIDASAVTTASNNVSFDTGGGDDVLTGGAGADVFNFYTQFLNSFDTVDGGTGASLDSLVFKSGGTIDPSFFLNVSHIEQIVLGSGSSIAVTDAMVGSSDNANLLTVAATGGTIDASGVTTAGYHVALNGSSTLETLIGGAGDDIITGGGNSDSLTGNGGSDRFVYVAASDSTGQNFDTLTDIDFASDRIDVTHAVSAIDPALSTGTLGGSGTFDSEMTTALTGHLNAFDAILFTPDAGAYHGQTFLVVDLNGTAGYQVNGDLVIDVTGYSGTLATTDFV